MLRYKAPETVCGIVSQIGRDGETSRTMTLAELRNTKVDMFTTVLRFLKVYSTQQQSVFMRLSRWNHGRV